MRNDIYQNILELAKDFSNSDAFATLEKTILECNN